ncbi:YbaB/EbfC family nucleoid-associated protein [Phytohabitans suffuscus]|uniref:YbaB/EbfC DNA-binding family protein n=1 Tax=Phytohabitans suffuscus TaxID=624315 RepID=A0A6F8YHJ8_9ACTN|nr:YbaB/EbfC family nucleoid-associated protein [Phytohabitans suffuscus]BCB85513.1 hypothetical protein Psuf_028260 [Phytohabitans suffuscus]
MSENDSARLLAELAELHTQARALAAQLSTDHDPGLRCTGADRNGLARVTVDGHGRPTGVTVAPDWRRGAAPPDLARALLDAMGEAQARRLEAWVAGSAPATTALLDRTLAPGLFDASGPELIRDLLPILDRAEQQLDEASRQLTDHFTEKALLSGPGGEVTITTEGGQVTGIEFDDRWITTAAAEEVAHILCRLFQEAHDRSWVGIGDLLPPELGDLTSFAADPDRMLRQLGLRA